MKIDYEYTYESKTFVVWICEKCGKRETIAKGIKTNECENCELESIAKKEN